MKGVFRTRQWGPLHGSRSYRREAALKTRTTDGWTWPTLANASVTSSTWQLIKCACSLGDSISSWYQAAICNPSPVRTSAAPALLAALFAIPCFLFAILAVCLSSMYFSSASYLYILLCELFVPVLAHRLLMLRRLWSCLLDSVSNPMGLSVVISRINSPGVS